jgi:anti-sigma factor RsiW
MGSYLKVTDLDIQAFVDGEISEAENLHFQILLALNPEARKRCEQLIQQRARLRKWQELRELSGMMSHKK